MGGTGLGVSSFSTSANKPGRRCSWEPLPDNGRAAMGQDVKEAEHIKPLASLEWMSAELHASAGFFRRLG
jgi:hypothetical protein